MDGNEVAGQELDNQIKALRAEVTRLKAFEPKPRVFRPHWLVIALLVGVAIGFCGASPRASPDRHRYSYEP